jgi:hypothetical protein
MTLTAAGDLGISETSPGTFGKLVVKGGTINLVTDTAAQRRVSFWSQGNGNSENAYIQVQNDGSTTNTGEILFATRNSGGTLAERSRITAEGNLLVGTTSFTTSASASAGVSGGNFRSVRSTATIPGLTTATILTLSSSVTGVYIVNANFGPQGNEIYGGMLIVVANSGSFRIVTNGSGANCALTLSGANVQITNALGSALDGNATAVLIAS